MTRVLVIEDDSYMRDAACEMLQAEGLEVASAKEGREALQMFTREPFDLVVTDLVMPGMEGIETIAWLRRRYPKTPVIAISGGGRTFPGEYLTAARQLGASRTLAKPFERRELVEAVRSALRLGEDGSR